MAETPHGMEGLPREPFRYPNATYWSEEDKRWIESAPPENGTQRKSLLMSEAAIRSLWVLIARSRQGPSNLPGRQPGWSGGAEGRDYAVLIAIANRKTASR